MARTLASRPSPGQTGRGTPREGGGGLSDRLASLAARPSSIATRDSAQRSAAGVTGRNPIADSYEGATQRLRMHQQDPYAEQAQRERELGYRFVDPYAAAAEAAREIGRPWRETLVGKSVFPGGDVFPRQAVWSFPGQGGQRQTQWGTYGTVNDTWDPRWQPEWDARRRLGYAARGSRDAGDDMTWDYSDRNRRVSGRIVGVGSMTQKVHNERPWLSVRATASLELRLTAGMSGGFEGTRRFFLGAGFTSSFLLQDFDTLRIEVLAVEAAATQLQFAWVTQGMQDGTDQLFFPQRITAAMVLVPQAVPEGAFGVFVEFADAAWTWDAPVLAGFAIASGVTGSAPGVTIPSQLNQVLGTRFTPGLANDIVWILRPL